MSIEASAWEAIRSHKNNMLDLPTIEEMVLPKEGIVADLLAHQVCWIVGPPKIGKTVLAHFVAYLGWLTSPTPTSSPSMMTIEGGAECARAVDLAIEAPYTDNLSVVIFENPFGSRADRPNAVFLRQLELLLQAKPSIKVLITTRPRGYVAYRNDIDRLRHYCTPLALSEWYATEALSWYAKHRGSLDLSDVDVASLGAPALIDDYIFHKVAPGTPGQRGRLRQKFGGNIEDITLDKFVLLKDRPDLGRLAALIRLQEHAATLPTSDELSALAGFQVEDHPHLGLVAQLFEFDGLKRLRFEHSTAREAADLFLSEASLAVG